MEIQNPKELDMDGLQSERAAVIRQMSRLTVYLGLLNDEVAERTAELPEIRLLRPQTENIRGLFE